MYCKFTHTLVQFLNTLFTTLGIVYLFSLNIYSSNFLKAKIKYGNVCKYIECVDFSQKYKSILFARTYVSIV